MTEDFEGVFPGPGWQSLSDDPAYGWLDRDCNPLTGSYSAWSHGGGEVGTGLSCHAEYPPNANHWLVYGPFSLADADAAEWSFAYWIETEPDLDRFLFVLSTNGEDFGGWYVSGLADGWQTQDLDLSDVPEIGSVVGADEVWLAFAFRSDDSLGFEGAYVDDVVLRADIGSQPPGSTATRPPISPTPGATRTRTPVPYTPTGPSTIYLPNARRTFPGHKDPRRESVASVQQAMPVSAFESVIARDPDLAAAHDLAAATTGTRDLQWAGTLADDDGVQMMFAELAEGPDDPTVLVRHCRNGICVSAMQTYLPDRSGVRWTTPDGDIPVRTARMPFQLRWIDEDDPDGSAVIAPTDDGSILGMASGGRVLTVENLFGSAPDRHEQPGTAPLPPSETGSSGYRPTGSGSPSTAELHAPAQNRRIRLASAFGKYLTTQGPNIDDLASSMRAGGFPDAQTIYHVNESEVDTNLATLGPSDAFVWLTHGDLNRSKGKVVGMTVARAAWGSKHYPSSRMTEQLTKNRSGGPGIVVLAGCKTADLIPVFDNGQRIVLAFNNNVMPGAASTAIKAFFNRLAQGGTMQEALDAANAQITDPKLRLVANPGANLSMRLVDLGTPTACSPHFAGGWQGTLTVTRGSPRLPEGSSVRYDCGRFTLAQATGTNGFCKGCWVSGTFAARALSGCAQGANVTLHHTDGGTEFIMDMDLVDQGTVRLTNWSKDTDGNDITRTGTFSRCN